MIDLPNGGTLLLESLGSRRRRVGTPLILARATFWTPGNPPENVTWQMEVDHPVQIEADELFYVDLLSQLRLSTLELSEIWNTRSIVSCTAKARVHDRPSTIIAFVHARSSAPMPLIAQELRAWLLEVFRARLPEADACDGASYKNNHQRRGYRQAAHHGAARRLFRDLFRRDAGVNKWVRCGWSGLYRSAEEAATAAEQDVPWVRGRLR